MAEEKEFFNLTVDITGDRSSIVQRLEVITEKIQQGFTDGEGYSMESADEDDVDI